MNHKIKNLDYTKILFADCETVRGEEVFDSTHPHYSVWQWKQRNKETNEFLSDEENIKLYYDKAALFPEWGKIACISVGFIHKNEFHIKSFVGQEKEILTSFISIVKSTGRSMVFHNAEFDVPYIRKRWFINGMSVEEYLTEQQGNDVGVKVWDLEKSVHDSMKWWKGSTFANTSLDELAMCFHIPSSKTIMHGNETSNYFYLGKLKALQQYCEADVAVLGNLIRVWKGDSILEPILRQDVEVGELPLLQKIYKATSIDSKTKKDLQKKLTKNKLIKKDKEVIEDILVSLYINNTMFSSDKPEVKEQKRNEIKEIVNGSK